MAHDVFISYSAPDKASADAMCATLEGAGIRCWIAPRDIPPGDDWSASIIDAIGRSRVFVLIFSAASNESDQVKREVQNAVEDGLPVLPFRIEAAPLSKHMRYFIGTPHWLDAMTPPLEKHLRQLAGIVRLLLERPTVPGHAGPPHEPPAVVAPARARKERLVSQYALSRTVVVAGLVATALGVVYLFTRSIVVDASGHGQFLRIGDAVRRAWPWTEIRVRPRTYDEALEIQRSVSIRGDGGPRDAIILRSNSASCVTVLGGMVTIRSLTLSGLAGGVEQPAVEVSQGHLDLSDCAVSSDGTACVQVSGPSASADLEGCLLSDSDAQGLAVEHRAQAVARNTRIERCTGTGIWVKGATVRLENCAIDQTRTGLRVFDGGRCEGVACEVTANREQGVEVRDGSSTVQLRRWRVQGNQSSGIHVHTDAHVWLFDCPIADNGLHPLPADDQPGIDIRNGGQLEARRCVVSGNGRAGVWIGRARGTEEPELPGSGRNGAGTLIDCTLNGNRRVGIEVETGGAFTAMRTRIHGSPKAVWLTRGTGTLDNCEWDGALDPPHSDWPIIQRVAGERVKE